MRSGEALRVGDQLGRYRLVRELGRGSMGKVFLAQDTMLAQPICVKVLHPALAEHPEAVERFNREILLARRITHRGVCRLHDIHAEGGIRFITMEYVEGVVLRDLLQPEQPALSVKRVITICASICEALAAAHKGGVIHRDLKPRNIVIRPSDDATILDFGIATALDAASSLTMPGIALGTKHYIAPEVWAGRPATPRSDQFAVGVVIYNCLTRKMPFGATRDGQLLDEMSRRRPAPPSAHRAELPTMLDGVVLRALAFAPEARFADMLTLRDALLRSLNEPVQVTKAPSAPVIGGGAVSAPAAGELPPTLPSLLAPSHAADFVPLAADAIPPSDASWVVSGRPVNLPAIPKPMVAIAQPVLHGIADMVEPDERLETRRRRPRLAAAILVGAALIALAIVAAGELSRWSGAASGAASDAGALPGAAASSDGSPSEPPDDAAVAAPAAEQDRVASRPPAEAGPRKPSADPDRQRYQEARGALRRVMEERGLLMGDDAELDRLSNRAAQEAQQRSFGAALRTLEEAQAQARAVNIDRRFVDAKLARFNSAFDQEADPKRRAAADAQVAKIMTALTEKRYHQANATLNRALAILR